MAKSMANFGQCLYDRSKAVTMWIGGTVVSGSGNPFNGLIRAGNGVPTAEQGRVLGSTSAFFQSIPAGAPRGLYSPGNTFGPRFGFAYAPTVKTVIRGGFGMFFNRPEGNGTF